MDYTFTPNFLQELKIKEVCAGGNKSGLIYIGEPEKDDRLEIISDRFNWRDNGDLSGDFGLILRVIN